MALMMYANSACLGADSIWAVQTSSTLLRAAVPVQLEVVRSQAAQADPPPPAMAPYRCRVIPAHADVGLKMLAPNGCVVEISIVPGRTRLSRFELDPVMSVDVVVYEGNQRVGFLSTRLTYFPSRPAKALPH